MAKGAAQKAISWQSRDCPADFDIVFVEHGRLECESWYRARRTTITRWLEERGKARLLKLRRNFVAFQRGLKRPKTSPKKVEPIQCRAIDLRLVELASIHLRSNRNGGWVVYPCDDGSFMVGTRRRSPVELIELAEAKGFDSRRARQQIKTFAEAV